MFPIFAPRGEIFAMGQFSQLLGLLMNNHFVIIGFPTRISQFFEGSLDLYLLQPKTGIAVAVGFGLVFKRLFLTENPVANMMVRTTDAYHF
jgi:hypothetical protein